MEDYQASAYRRHAVGYHMSEAVSLDELELAAAPPPRSAEPIVGSGPRHDERTRATERVQEARWAYQELRAESDDAEAIEDARRAWDAAAEALRELGRGEDR